MPKVYNKYHGDAPADAVYIGRPSLWGSPFSHMRGAAAAYRASSREEAVAMYVTHLRHNPKLVQAAKRMLKGKDLVCFCAPKACHGDILLEIANEEESITPPSSTENDSKS